MGGEADCLCVGGEQAFLDEASDGGHGLRDGVVAKLAAKRGEVDAGVHAEAEEPGFFKLAGWGEPGGFDGGWAGKKCAEVVDGGSAEDVGRSRSCLTNSLVQWKHVPQGLKPRDFWALCGATKVVP